MYLLYEGRGLCGRGRAFWRSLIRAQGPGDGDRVRARVKMLMCGERSWNLCATGWKKREKSAVRMELEITGILHAGCFLANGLPKEYNNKSDCPVHVWIRILKVGVLSDFLIISRIIYLFLLLLGYNPCVVLWRWTLDSIKDILLLASVVSGEPLWELNLCISK